MNIVIIDDHPIVSEGMQKILLQAYKDAIINCFTDSNNFLAWLQKNETEVAIDIIILDITLPGMSGITLCKKIKELTPQTCVIAFSNHIERSIIIQMLQQGANGYLLKSVPADELIECISEALEGKIVLTKAVREIMAKPTLEDFWTEPVLTKREKEILKMIADGNTTVSIAEKLFLSTHTIESHRRNLLQKFNVNNAMEMVKIAAKQKII